MAYERAQNLDADAIESIVSILDGWSGKLSWDLLIEAIARRRHVTYTRQALHNHERVRHAFGLRKKTLLEERLRDPKKTTTPELQATFEAMALLKAENVRLKAENERLLGQFATWAYNAHQRGLDKDYLNRPLPRVNRDQTVQPLRAVKRSSK